MGMGIPGNFQGQVGWASEQSGAVEYISAHCNGVSLGVLEVPYNPNYSMNLKNCIFKVF